MSLGKALFWIFIVIIVLTLYYGAVQLVNAGGTQAPGIIFALTGRTTSGQPSGYPALPS